MRLGAYPCVLEKGSIAADAYQSTQISERHRHRYEVNNTFRDQIGQAGLVLSGLSPDGRLVEMIELRDHPHFSSAVSPIPSSRAARRRPRTSAALLRASSRRRCERSRERSSKTEKGKKAARPGCGTVRSDATRARRSTEGTWNRVRRPARWQRCSSAAAGLAPPAEPTIAVAAGSRSAARLRFDPMAGPREPPPDEPEAAKEWKPGDIVARRASRACRRRGTGALIDLQKALEEPGLRSAEPAVARELAVRVSGSSSSWWWRALRAAVRSSFSSSGSRTRLP